MNKSKERASSWLKRSLKRRHNDGKHIAGDLLWSHMNENWTIAARYVCYVRNN